VTRSIRVFGFIIALGACVMTFFAFAQEKKKEYFLLAAYSDKTCAKPVGALSTDKIYEWTWDNLETLIGAGR